MALRPLFRCAVYYRATHLNEWMLMVKLALRAHVGNEWRAEKLRGKKLSQRGSKHRRKVLPNVRESSREDGHGLEKKVSTNRCGVNEAVTHQVSLHPRHPCRCLHHRLGRPRHH